MWIVPYRTLNHRLAIESDNGWLSMSLEILDYATFANIMQFKMSQFSCWNIIHDPIREKMPPLFGNVVLGSLKSFFQLDHQVDISLYLTEATALRHCRELANLKLLWCIFNPISLHGFMDFKINFIIFHNKYSKYLIWFIAAHTELRAGLDHGNGVHNQEFCRNWATLLATRWSFVSWSLHYNQEFSNGEFQAWMQNRYGCQHGKIFC